MTEFKAYTILSFYYFGLNRGHRERHFLRDILKSFQEVTPMGPEPHQFFFFLEYLNK